VEFLILDRFPDPAIEKAWRACLDEVRFPSHYCAPEFFLEPFWEGNQPFAVLALEQDTVVGVLTGLHENKQTESGLQWRPQICVRDGAGFEAVLDALARGLIEAAGSSSLVSVFSWRWNPLGVFSRYGFRHRSFEGDVVLDLTRGAESVFHEFSKNRRRDIRLAIKNGVEVFEASTSEDFLAYYDVYLRWRQTARKSVQGSVVPYETFERALRLKDSRRVFLARFSGRIIAGTSIRYYPKGLVEYSENASLDDFLHLCPNDLLLWRSIEWACKGSFPQYSLGAADYFHRKCGGTVVPIDRYRLDRTWLGTHTFRERLMESGREVFHRLPGPLTNTLRGLLKRQGSRR